MSSAAESRFIAWSQVEQLREGRAIVAHEAAALADLARHLDAGFCTAAESLYDCTGSVLVTGMGKAGLIGQKIAATLASTGTRAHFLHPAEALHGDLGRLHAGDVLLALSNSGETDEICRLVPLVRRMQVPVVAVTASETSTLGAQADVVVRLGKLREAGPHGLAPTTSTTAMLALGDALALVVSRRKGFTPQQFARYHPGGSLGQKLRTVREVMRHGPELRTAPETVSIREAFVGQHRPGRRTGAVMLVDARGCLSGVFTDSDLVRLLEQRRDGQLDGPIADVMTSQPLTIRPEALLIEAVDVLTRTKVSELPVIDEAGRPVGLIDITDVLALLPQAEG